MRGSFCNQVARGSSSYDHDGLPFDVVCRPRASAAFLARALRDRRPRSRRLNRRRGRPLLLVGVRHESTTRATGAFGVFVPFAPIRTQGCNPGVLAGYWGLNVEAGVADGGRRLAIGAAARVWDPDFFRIPAPRSCS
jgi:hypothetical protein